MVNLSSARNHFPSRNRPRRCRVRTHTLQLTTRVYLTALPEIVKFREMLETRATENALPLETVPEAYKPLIAKLAHERSAFIHCNISSLMMCGIVIRPSKR